jgi:hypothetical protein
MSGRQPIENLFKALYKRSSNSSRGSGPSPSGIFGGGGAIVGLALLAYGASNSLYNG